MTNDLSAITERVDMRFVRPRASAMGSIFTAVALFVVLVVIPAGDTDPPGNTVPKAGAIFNTPTGTTEEQYRIRDYVQDLVDSTEAGEVIRISMYRISDHEDGFVDSLIAAKDRGVDIQIVFNAMYAGTGSAQKLIDRLGNDQAKDSWTTICSSGCHGEKLNHNKFYTFSNVGGKSDVVVQSSANLTEYNAEKFWNNAVTLINAKLYDGYVDYFKDLAQDEPDDSYYTTVHAGQAKAYYFPRADDGDTVSNTLNNVDCGSEDETTTIRVGMWYVNRSAVAEKLAGLADESCEIKIVYTTISDKAESLLDSASNVAMRALPESQEFSIHSKYYLIDGTYRDTARKVVFTGSHNLTNGALHKNDEALLRLYSDEIYDQYRANFDRIYDTHGGNDDTHPE